MLTEEMKGAMIFIDGATWSRRGFITKNAVDRASDSDANILTAGRFRRRKPDRPLLAVLFPLVKKERGSMGRSQQVSAHFAVLDRRNASRNIRFFVSYVKHITFARPK
jgi:hypothetical protein